MGQGSLGGAVGHGGPEWKSQLQTRWSPPCGLCKDGETCSAQTATADSTSRAGVKYRLCARARGQDTCRLPRRPLSLASALSPTADGAGHPRHTDHARSCVCVCARHRLCEWGGGEGPRGKGSSTETDQVNPEGGPSVGWRDRRGSSGGTRVRARRGVRAPASPGLLGHPQAHRSSPVPSRPGACRPGCLRHVGESEGLGTVLALSWKSLPISPEGED